MDTSTKEILDFEAGNRIRKPLYSKLSFAFGLVVLVFFAYFRYRNSQVSVEEILSRRDFATIRFNMIVTFVYSSMYFTSFTCLVIALIRKEKSILKTIASIGHILVLLSSAIQLLPLFIK